MGDIGTSGENFFLAFCAGDGITANRSHTDKNGWDVLIEIDQCASVLTQQTLHEPVITGLVQVKSTETSSLKVPVTLSNLRKLASSSLPAFYLLMDLSKAPVPSRALLLHIDENLIQRILEKVNLHLVAGNKLNKRKMILDFSQGKEIPLNGAASFRAEFLSVVGRSQATYTENKQRFLKTVGFEDGTHLMRFDLIGPENVQAMVDATLGRGGPVELQNMQIYSKRFGLEDPRSAEHASIGTLVIEPSSPDATGTLTVRNRRTGESVQVDAIAYVSSIHTMLPATMIQIRIDCGLFDWCMNAKGSEARFVSTLNPAVPVELERLCTYLQVTELMAQAEGLSIEMEFNGQTLRCTTKSGSLQSNFPGALQVAETLLKIKIAFKDRGKLLITMQDLMAHAQSILRFHALLSKEAEANVVFSATGKSEPFPAVCLMPWELNVGGKYYLTILAVTGEMSLLPSGMFSMPMTEFETVYKTVLREHERTQESTLTQLQLVVDQYSHPLPRVGLLSQ